MITSSVPSEFSLDKSERRYGVEGLNDREVLVLKSMIRLLDHRTNHSWKYAPSTTELMVVSDKLSAADRSAMQAQQVLTLGVRSFSLLGFLCMPVNARELEVELNRLGALIVPVRRTEQLHSEAVHSEAAYTAPGKYLETEPMRMLRWPPPALLKGPGRLRLATLMTGKQMSVHSLQRRSGESLAACSAFFDELKSANLLTQGDKVPPPQGQASPQILLRQTVPPQKNVVPTSLLDRIRMRLGIRGGSASTQHSGA